MSDLDTAPIRADLEEIRKKYEASRGISYEDLAWLLDKLNTAIALAEASQRLAKTSRALSDASLELIDSQQAEIERLNEELSAYEL